jgi:hypothetical protein
MARPVHFEVHADDLDRAQRFYEAVLDWRFQDWAGGDYRLITTGAEGPGIDGGMVRRRGPAGDDQTPVIAWVCTVAVDDVDAYLARALANGGALALPKMPIKGVGWLAYAKDTEGNIFGLMHNDPSAA